jgi:hypothetical protein
VRLEAGKELAMRPQGERLKDQKRGDFYPQKQRQVQRIRRREYV